MEGGKRGQEGKKSKKHEEADPDNDSRCSTRKQVTRQALGEQKKPGRGSTNNEVHRGPEEGVVWQRATQEVHVRLSKGFRQLLIGYKAQLHCPLADDLADLANRSRLLPPSWSR